MRALARSRLFWVGLAVRLAAFPFFGSYFLTDLFAPFLDAAVLHPLENPWSLSPPMNFPYGSALFVLLDVPRFLAYHLVGDVALGSGPLGQMLIKAPLLGLELVLLASLARLAERRTDQVLVYYWLNPIPIFITYVHGQLDVAAMAFCFLALTALTEQRTTRAGVWLGLATLCKFHVVALLPFWGVYLWNRHFAREAVRRLMPFGGAWAVVSVVGFLPLLTAERLLYATTSSPEAFRVFAAQLSLGGGDVLYLGVFATLAVVGRLCLSSRITDYGLLFGSGCILGTLLLVTAPMPGWYFWVLPFLSLFYATYVNVSPIPFAGLIAVYLVYFAGLRHYGATTPPPTLVAGVVFTVLQTSLAGLLAAVWILAVRKGARLQGRAQPVLIGVAGDSGAGKNHLSELIKDLFTPGQTLTVEGDDYHKWDRTHEAWQDYTHLHPKANLLATLADHADKLVQGRPVFHPHYDHHTGTFTAPREVKPGKTVVIQGLHTLYPRGLRRQFDLSVFLQPDERVRLFWKLRRDVQQRGHSVDKVLDALARRTEDSALHIAPQRAYADWVVEHVPTDGITREEVVAGREPTIGVRHVLWNDAPIQELVEALRALPELKIGVETVPGDMDRMIFTASGPVTRAQVEQVARAIYPDLRFLTRARQAPTFRDGDAGITQLLMLSLLRGANPDRLPVAAA